MGKHRSNRSAKRRNNDQKKTAKTLQNPINDESKAGKKNEQKDRHMETTSHAIEKDKYRRETIELSPESEEILKQVKLRKLNESENFELNDITNTYSEIRKHSNEQDPDVEWFDYVNMMNNSTYAGRIIGQRRLIQFQKCIFDLSEEWDAWLEDHREEYHGRHRFFISCSVDPEGRRYTAKAFNLNNDDDIKIVAIQGGKSLVTNWTMSYMPFLHEMGHYVGGRNRNDRVRLIIFLVLSMYMQELDEVCLHYINENSIEEELIREFPENDARNTRYEYIKESCKESCRYIGSILKKNFADSPVDPNHGSTIYYSKKCISEIIDELQTIINDSLFLNEYERICREWYNKDEPLYVAIIEAMRQIAEQFKNQKEERISLIRDSFEEPLADCFMIAIGDLNWDEYLTIIMNQAWRDWTIANCGEQDIGDFVELFHGSIMHDRVLSILFAKRVEPDVLYEKIKKHAFLKKQIAFQKAEFFIYEEYRDMVKILDQYDITLKADKDTLSKTNILKFEDEISKPWLRIGMYISYILNYHEHYMDVRDGKAHAKVVDKIRSYKRKTRLGRWLSLSV